MKFRLLFRVLLCTALVPTAVLGQDGDLAKAIETVKKVDANGAGHDSAIEAIKVLNRASIDDVPTMLAAMDGTNKISANWMRAAIVAVVGRSAKLPVDKIEAYFKNVDGSRLGRSLAFDLLSEANPQWSKDVVPTLIDDPSLPLRRRAIKAWISKAESAEATESLGILATALKKAREADQVVEISKLLDERGVAVDLQKQLGFLHTWHIVGNFDNKEESGFDIEYGPEKSIDAVDLAATYTNVDEEEVNWSVHTTSEPTGVVDLNEVIGKVKGVIAYASTTFKAEEARSCEIRVGCINAHKVWVNGELVMSNEIYHNGISPDKFSAPAKLKKGDNEIVIKVCQNEQTQPWAQRWQFQVRVCDEMGLAIPPAKPAPQRF